MLLLMVEVMRYLSGYHPCGMGEASMAATCVDGLQETWHGIVFDTTRCQMWLAVLDVLRCFHACSWLVKLGWFTTDEIPERSASEMPPH